MLSKLKFDVLERAGWTGAQAALAILIAEIANVSVWWAAPVGLALAAAKGWIAGRLGRNGTASTLPESKDPATPMRAVGLGPRGGSAGGPPAP
ncbi:hypothetical protein AB0J38_12020 [Streptomyces sp. NPDC050095]|uniref:hypothetical protein n=1 Tax=unclassified Streptomyces TaxID=2593676 RepID=UPI00342BAB31